MAALESFSCCADSATAALAVVPTATRRTSVIPYADYDGSCRFYRTLAISQPITHATITCRRQQPQQQPLLRSVVVTGKRVDTQMDGQKGNTNGHDRRNSTTLFAMPVMALTFTLNQQRLAIVEDQTVAAAAAAAGGPSNHCNRWRRQS